METIARQYSEMAIAGVFDANERRESPRECLVCPTLPLNYTTHQCTVPRQQGGLAIFVESAALYSAWATLFVILYLSRSPLQTVGSGCGPSMIGISFMLITVRVGLGWSQESKFGPRAALPGRSGHGQGDRKSTRLNSSHSGESRMPSSA